MTPISYLMSVTTYQNNVEAMLAIFNIAGKGQAFYSYSKGAVSTGLWIIPKGKRNPQEVITKLQAIPAIRSVSIITLSHPLKETELAEVRELFAGIGWDASDVTNDVLSLFITAKLQKQYTYYIDYNHRKRGPVKIEIKPIEEHPHFSPDWLKTIDSTEDERPGREFTINDIEIRSVVLMEQEDEPPPPLPPPLNNK